MSLEKPPPPTPEQPNPYIPEGPPPLLFEEFQGIDTQVPRCGVPDSKMFWCDGFMPIAKRNLRTLGGKGTLFYTASGILTIVWFGFYEINQIPYAVVFLSDGSIAQIQVSNGATTQIAPAGTIQGPSIVSTGFTDYSDQYLIIVSSQTNGYWLWDGTLFYRAGGLSPIVTLTNVGAGYKTTPVVTASGGSGSGATFVATIANGVVTNVVVTNPGTGYLPGQTVTLAFSGGNSGGSGGALTAVLSSTGGGSGATFTVTMASQTNGWFVSSVVVTGGGSGYSAFTTLTININYNGGAGSVTTAAVLQPVISGGSITGVTIVNAGLYSNAFHTTTATLTATDAGAFHVTSVTINNGGSGYSPSATAIASGGGSPVSQATLQLVLTAGVITGVTVASGGLYGSNTPPTVTVADAPVNATATAELMPFGVSGTAVETYSGHVWVVSGAQVNGSAPGSPDDFATSDGGVSFTATANSYTQLISTNGFLFLVGDSATDYISGVTTSGTPPTTTYSYLNADPEVGSPYPASVLTFGNQLMLANAVGVHQLAGSTFTKISDDLDGSGIPNGLWGSVNIFGGNQISSSKAIVFGKKVWMTLATVLDPVSGLQVNKLFMTKDMKNWWASMQDMTLTFIASYENDSVLTAYGTDGINIYPLFQTPSTGFTKTVQSRFWDAPGGYTHTKSSVRLFGLAYQFNPTLSALSITVDSISQWNGASSAAYILAPAATGYFVFPPLAVGQVGELTGLTLTTVSADMSLISMALQDELVAYRG